MRNPTVIFPEPRKVVIEDHPVPEPGEGEVLVKAERTLISTGTELTILTGEFPPGGAWSQSGRYPFKPGYSHVGRVASVGEGVDKSWVGRRVGSYSRHTLYAAVALPNLRVIDRDVDPDHVSFFTLAEIAMNGVRRGRVTWGEAVAVYGVGLLGQLTVEFCWLAGARPVIGIDLAAERLARLPKGTGLYPINADGNDIEEKVSSCTRDRMCDVVFEVTGNPELIPQELSILRPQGRFVVLSSPRGPSKFDFHDLCNAPSFTIIGAHNRSHPRVATLDSPWTQHRHCELFLDMLATRQVDMERLISHRVPCDDAPRMYEQLLQDRSKMMGVVLEWE